MSKQDSLFINFPEDTYRLSLIISIKIDFLVLRWYSEFEISFRVEMTIDNLLIAILPMKTLLISLMTGMCALSF